MKYLMLTVLLLMAIAGPAQAHCGKNRVYVYGARWCPACRATDRFLTDAAGRPRILMIAPGNLHDVMTEEGRLRPIATRDLDVELIAKVNSVCPGLRVGSHSSDAAPAEAEFDDVWGPHPPW